MSTEERGVKQHVIGKTVSGWVLGYSIDRITATIFIIATSGTIVLGRLIGSSLVESFTNSYTLTDPNGTEEKYTT